MAARPKQPQPEMDELIKQLDFTYMDLPELIEGAYYQVTSVLPYTCHTAARRSMSGRVIMATDRLLAVASMCIPTDNMQPRGSQKLKAEWEVHQAQTVSMHCMSVH